jgi:hypothetical protein
MSPFGDTHNPAYLAVLLSNSSNPPILMSPFSDIFFLSAPLGKPGRFLILLFEKGFSLLAQGLL